MGPEQVKALTDSVGNTVSTAVAPILKAQQEQGQAVATLAEQVGKIVERVDALEKRPAGKREVFRVDAQGRVVQLFQDGDVAGAPAVLRGDLGLSKPLQVSNILRGVLAKDLTKYAPEECAFSEKLRGVGYNTDFIGSILFPMGEGLFPQKSVDGRDFSEIRKEAAARLSIQFDPGEVAWIAKKYPEFAQRMFPETIKSTGDMQVSTDTLGGQLIPTAYGDRIIDLLRNRLSVMRAGATELTLPPSGNITWTRLNEDPAPSYGDPDTATDGTATRPGLAAVRLQAKGLKAWVTIPNDLIRYSSPSVELLVRMALAAKFAVFEDQQFLEGIGSSLAPKGIINYPASVAETPTEGKITTHVSGLAPTGNTLGTFQPEDVAKMIALYFTGNDPDAPTGWILRPVHWASIMNKRADAVTAADGKGPFMFWTSRGDASAALPDRLAGYNTYQTAQVSKNRVQGTTTTGTYVLFGNFRRVLIGRVGTMELAVSEHIKFFQDKLVIRAVERHDMALEHEESFVFCDAVDEAL